MACEAGEAGQWDSWGVTAEEGGRGGHVVSDRWGPLTGPGEECVLGGKVQVRGNKAETGEVGGARPGPYTGWWVAFLLPSGTKVHWKTLVFFFL